MTWASVTLAIAVAINFGATIVNVVQSERHRRRVNALTLQGAQWVANAERLDALAGTVRRMLADDAPPAAILATLDAEHERLS